MIAKTHTYTHPRSVRLATVKTTVLSAILFVLLASTAVSQRVTIQGGDGLLTRRDSVLQFRLDPVAYKRIGDSLGFAGKDTITFVARTSFTDADTASKLYFCLLSNRSTAAYRFLSIAHAMGDWKVISIAVTHEMDSTGYYGERDTVDTHTANTLVIPRYSHIFICYTPASSYGTSDPASNFGHQEVSVFYIEPYTGATMTRAFRGVQVPQIPKSPWKNWVGVKSDHFVTVTIKLAQQ